MDINEYINEWWESIGCVSITHRHADMYIYILFTVYVWWRKQNGAPWFHGWVWYMNGFAFDPLDGSYPLWLILFNQTECMKTIIYRTFVDFLNHLQIHSDKHVSPPFKKVREGGRIPVAFNMTWLQQRVLLRNPDGMVKQSCLPPIWLDGIHHPFIVKLGMVYYGLTNTTNVLGGWVETTHQPTVLQDHPGRNIRPAPTDQSCKVCRFAVDGIVQVELGIAGLFKHLYCGRWSTL